jgi:hypothetical protein
MGFLSEMFNGAEHGPLAKALIGLLILIGGLIIVNIVTSIIRSSMSKVSLLNRTMADGSRIDLVSPIVSIIKAVLTIFLLMTVLQYFGLTDVLEPLKDMLNEFMATIPNIIGAGIVGYAGWIIAKTASQLVGMVLKTADAKIAERTGNVDIKVSPFGSAVVFGSVLLPIVVAALGILNIPAISDPASEMIGELMTAVPNIIGAGIIVLVAYVTAKFINFMLGGLFEGMQLDSFPAKMGMDGIFSPSFTLTKLVQSGIMFFSLLAASTAAVEVLGIDVISSIFSEVLKFGGGILTGGVILVVGNFLSNIAYQKLSASGSAGIAAIARFAILGLVLAMGLKSMGLADNIVTMAFGFTLGSVAIAAAIAFGFGGRDAAKSIADKWAGKMGK